MGATPDDKNEKQQVFYRKIAVMGFPSVGKSSVTQQFVFGKFPEFYDTTIEDTHHKSLTFINRHYNLEIIDTAGQLEYSIYPKSCTVIDGYVLMYSIDDKRSFEVVQVIRDRILDLVGDDALPIVLVANKTDREQMREISTECGATLAQEWHCHFIEMCAKDQKEKSEQVFATLLELIERYRNPRLFEAAKAQSTSKCIIM